MCVCVFVCVCVEGKPLSPWAKIIKFLWHSFDHSSEHYNGPHLSEFSLFSVLLQYLTHSLVSQASSNIQGCQSLLVVGKDIQCPHWVCTLLVIRDTLTPQMLIMHFSCSHTCVVCLYNRNGYTLFLMSTAMPYFTNVLITSTRSLAST